MSPWQVFFSWPSGGIWSNIIASIIWAGLPLTYAMIKQHRHHKLVENSLERLHHKLDKAQRDRISGKEGQ